MAGADRSIFGSMFRDIQISYGQGNNKYPKSVVDAKRYINTYKPDPKVVRVISQAKGVEFLTDGQEQQKKKDKLHITCFDCKKGHYSNECTKQAKEGGETGVSLLMACLNTYDDSNKEFAFTQAHDRIPKT
eukprot:5212926-Ditylum_brightwellii.AAC.1